MNVTEGLHLHDHGGLHSFRGHKEWSRWPVKQNRSCSNNSTYWQRTESARGCVKWINGPTWFLRFVTSAPFAFYFWYLCLLLRRVWPSVICHAMFSTLFRLILIIVSKYWLSREKVWQILWTCCIQNKVGNCHIQVGSHIMGPCRRPISGWRGLLLSFPTLRFFFAYYPSDFRAPFITLRPK